MESFDLKTAGSLLPSMDGNDTTKKLIDAIKFYESLLNNDSKKHLINYALKTRLSENAKIRLSKEYDSIENLIKDMQDNFITKKSANTLFNQLHHSKQSHQSINDYGQEIEQLLSDLTLAQADVFLLENDPVTVTDIIKETITLKKDARPVYVKRYRLPYSQKAEIDKQILKMLADGIIEETKSSWSSPILLVPKKSTPGNSRVRAVIDYRLVNKNLEDYRFPLPNITEILDSLSGAFYFTHLDFSQGYYQVELEPSCRKYTAFTTSKSQYQMTRLPMGMKTSPSAFSRVMTIAMSGLNYDSCLYI
ncbi:Reverse transcriptase (RNA-dependent DNA polymerase) [Popillia japonica]|uniref:Reverse transcriptase (RNA-dependent DNA polymerase) n=1 Tax=Popillia japonica TaxID=7064 RepID=A0AAW1LQG2_POPJA